MAAGAGVFIEASKTEPPARILKRVVLDAVYRASARKIPAYLRYDGEKATFLVTDAGGESLAAYPIYEDLEERRKDGDGQLDLPVVTFRAEGPLSGPGGGGTEIDDEFLELLRVPFFPGVSAPFSATIEVGGEEEELRFDPFSGYVRLKEEE